MVVHGGWPFDILRVRRTPEPDGEVVAIIPMPGQHLPLEQRHRWRVIEAESTPEFWRLAPGTKHELETRMRTSAGEMNCVTEDYDEATEGWVIRVYDGHQTLERYEELRVAAPRWSVAPAAPMAFANIARGAPDRACLMIEHKLAGP